MPDMLKGPRLSVAYSTPIWHEKICTNALESGRLLLVNRLIDRSDFLQMLSFYGTKGKIRIRLSPLTFPSRVSAVIREEMLLQTQEVRAGFHY